MLCWSCTMRRHRRTSLLLTGAVLLIPFNCTRPDSFGQFIAFASMTPGHYELQGGRAMSFALKSTAFANGGEIPEGTPATALTSRLH